MNNSLNTMGLLFATVAATATAVKADQDYLSEHYDDYGLLAAKVQSISHYLNHAQLSG